MELSVLEKLVDEDFGIVVQGERWAHSKEHDSLVIDREKQIFFFNSEELVGDAFQYLLKVRKLPPQDAKEYLKHCNFTGTFIHEIKDGNEVVVYPKLVEIFHQNLCDEARDYFHRRTITDETIDRYELGYYDGFVTIPIHQDGVFKQFQLRKDNPKVIRNYYKGVGGLLYNSGILQLTNKIVITEGVTSCIVMNQNGIPAVSTNTGASGFVPTWMRYFVHQKEIYLLYDNDQAGRLGAIRTAKILGENRCKIFTFWDEEIQGYDCNDWFKDGRNKDDLLETVYTQSKYSFEFPENSPQKRLTYRK